MLFWKHKLKHEFSELRGRITMLERCNLHGHEYKISGIPKIYCIKHHYISYKFKCIRCGKQKFKNIRIPTKHVKFINSMVVGLECVCRI